MKSNTRSTPKFEWAPPEKLGVDTFIYSVTQATFFYKRTSYIVDSTTLVDGRAIFLSNEDCTLQLFNCSIKDKNLRAMYLSELQHITSKSPVKYIKGNSFFCGDRFADGNMCHTTLDHLVRAWQAQKSPIEIDHFLFFDSTWEWSKTIIEKVIPKHKILYINELETLKCQKLLFCSNSWTGPGVGFAISGLSGLTLKHPACSSNKLFLQKLRRTSAKLIHTKHDPTHNEGGSSPTKVFVSRKTRSRRFSNQIEIENIFTKHGYRILYLENMNSAAQLKLFGEATHIAGFHGAGLTNLIACKKGTSILEIFGPEGSNAYQKICKSLELKYQHLNICKDRELTANLEVLENFMNNYTT